MFDEPKANRRVAMDAAHSLLLTDLYQLNMLFAYRAHGMTDIAVFELFVRELPLRRGFLMAAGLEQAIEFLEGMHFSEADLSYLRETGRFDAAFLRDLETLRFTGDVDALPEGSIFFQNEPVIRVVAPLPQAQLVETRLMNLLHYQTLVASKAARMVLAAPGKLLVDFGLRRAHGAEAGLLAARAAYLAGFAGSATTLAGQRFGIPIYGTMAHSFVQAHDEEARAFEHFALSRPDHLVLLIDTYDTEVAAQKVVELVPALRRHGIRVQGVRLDSGDLAAHARAVRAILDAGGLSEVTIFASGGLDEDRLLEFTRRGVPIDGFGVGTSLTTSSDVPALDCAYKLQEYAGIARRKRSEGKATWPGRKQVWRRYGATGRMADDILSIEGDPQLGEARLQPAMRKGRRIPGLPTLGTARRYAAAELSRLPESLRQLDPFRYPVAVAPALAALAAQCDARTSSVR
jgi:nicotinate phosphoribosyltransferase